MVMRRNARNGGVRITEPIVVDKDGNRVEPGSPAAHQQLFGVGAVLTAADAKKYGVVPERQKGGSDDVGVKTVGKGGEPAPENKSGVPAVEETKQGASAPATTEPEAQTSTKTKGKA